MDALLRIVALGSVLVVGCDSSSQPAGSRTAAPPAAPAPPRVFPEGAARVEIGTAKLTWVTPEILQFEIPYKFTGGGPRQVYTCGIDFPGTTARGATSFNGGDLELEGVIKTKIAVGEADVKTFAIEMYEARSIEHQYNSISTSAKGDVPTRPEDPVAIAEKKAGS